MIADREDTLFSDPRFPYLKTRPGRRRVQEIREILAQKASDRPALKGTLAKALAEVLKSQMSAEEAARALSGRTTADSREAFVDLDVEQLTDALRVAAGSHPTLNLRGRAGSRWRSRTRCAPATTGPRERGGVAGVARARAAGRDAASGRPAACWVGALVQRQARRGSGGRAGARGASWTQSEFSIAPLGGPVKVEAAACRAATGPGRRGDDRDRHEPLRLQVRARIGHSMPPRAAQRPTVGRGRSRA